MNKTALIKTIAAVSLAASANCGSGNNVNNARIVGYLPDWNYKAYSDISALTNINIAFCNPDSSGRICCSIPDDDLRQIVSDAHENGTEVFAALGGGGGCDGYLQHIDSGEKIARFDREIIEYCERYDLDGIDLDIELGADNEIWSYYGEWCTDLRRLCDEHDLKMSTATAGWVAEKVSPDTFALFDFVNVMAYDNDEDRYSHSSYEYAVECLDYFHNVKKIPQEKLVLGVPFYGRGYTEKGELDWESYASFGDIVSADKDNFTRDEYGGIAYNGAETMTEKCRLASGYGGIMIWEVTQDADGEYSLLKVIAENLK